MLFLCAFCVGKFFKNKIIDKTAIPLYNYLHIEL